MKVYHCGSLAILLLVCSSLSSASTTETITAVGSVTALTHRSQFGTVTGTADFGAGHASYVTVPPNTYAASGMMLHGVNGYDDGIENDAVSLASILPGVTTVGYAILPAYDFAVGLFKPTIGGGQQAGNYAIYGLTATFNVPVNQFGLTLSKNGPLYITAWDGNGAMIGQVNWQPAGEASFVGLSSGSTPMKMVTVGNDNLFAGAEYEFQGNSTIFDTVIWGVPEPNSLALTILAFATLANWSPMRRRR